MKLSQVLLIIYSLSAIIYLIWSYLDGTFGTYKLWEVPIGAFVVFFWIVFILGVTGFFPKTKDTL